MTNWLVMGPAENSKTDAYPTNPMILKEGLHFFRYGMIPAYLHNQQCHEINKNTNLKKSRIC